MIGGLGAVFMPATRVRNFGTTVTHKVRQAVELAMDKVLNKDTINPNLIKAQYAVRGELAIRAEELKEV